MGGNFREKLEEALRIKFRGFKFCGMTLYFCMWKRNVNFELGTRDANFGFVLIQQLQLFKDTCYDQFG